MDKYPILCETRHGTAVTIDKDLKKLAEVIQTAAEVVRMGVEENIL